MKQVLGPEVEKVVNPVILDDRKYFLNQDLAENILMIWKKGVLNPPQSINNIANQENIDIFGVKALIKP